ncbi:MAG TPA: GNAT family N-acetyltransferase [Anaerolineales bacterium]|nr:GNAT family N-acetyltransferase [Anaerolineales bacterium]
MKVNIRRLLTEDLPRLRQFWRERWGGDFMVTRGNIYRPEQLEGFVIEDDNEWIGLLTYFIKDDECEVTSLDSLRERQGIGTKLLALAIEEARARKCRRIFLITTNDNLNALGFYQKRGFELVTIRRNALAETRKLKPNIPLIGMNNIPLRDEIELEMMLLK